MSLTIELADVMLPGVSDVILDKDSDLIFMTVGMYKLFLSGTGGRDARDLYLHLMFTARMQETNQVWANKAYLKKGLSLGDARLKRAKALLKKLGLIEYVQPRKKGKVEKVFIRLTKLWSWLTIARAAGSVWSSPDFVDTLNCTCVSVSGGYPNTTCPPKTQPWPSTRKAFSPLWPDSSIRPSSAPRAPHIPSV